METLESFHALLHGEARFGCGLKGGDACKGRQVAVGRVFHKADGFRDSDAKRFSDKIQPSEKPFMKTPALAEKAC